MNWQKILNSFWKKELIFPKKISKKKRRSNKEFIKESKRILAQRSLNHLKYNIFSYLFKRDSIVNFLNNRFMGTKFSSQLSLMHIRYIKQIKNKEDRAITNKALKIKLLKKWSSKILLKKKQNKKHKSKFFIRSKKISSGVLHVYSTMNNTHITLTDKLGNIYLKYSGGTVGIKGSKRSSFFTGELILKQFIKEVKALDFNCLDLKIHGYGLGRHSIKILKKKKYKIRFITFETKIPHNGCRRKKQRRL